MHAILSRNAKSTATSARKSARAALPEPLESRLLMATYHVSPGGADANPGTDAAPFATLQRAANAVRAGDEVNVRAGTYAAGFRVTADGTASARITFRAEPGVTITGRNAASADGINLEGADYVTVEGFTVDNTSGTITRAGIRTVSNAGSVIRNNQSHRNGTWGVFTAFSEGVLIENNVCSRSGSEHGVYVSNSADNPVVRGNTLWGNRRNGVHMNGDAEVAGGDGVISGALVEDNVIYGNGAGGGSAINCDGVRDSVFRNNLLYDNHASGISLYRIDGGAPSTGNLVVNNTILMAPGGRWVINIQDGSTGNVVFNNVLYHPGSNGAIDASDDSLPGLVSDHNAVSNRFSAGGSYQTLAQWRASTGNDQHSFVVTDPSALFVNAAGGDYRLRSGSPAIDAGAASAGGRTAPAADRTGAARPAGAAHDIGAYESNGTVTPPAPDTTAPSISGVSASAVASGGATITWSTNEPATSRVEYGVTTAYGTFSPTGTAHVTSHSVSLSGLSPSTTYYFRALSSDAAGNAAASAGSTFTTAAAAPSDTTAPVAGGVASSGVSQDRATVTWSTNEPAFGQVEYGATTAYGAATAFTTSAATTHSHAVTGLTPASVYHYRVRSRDAAGNVSVSPDFTFTTAAATEPDPTDVATRLGLTIPTSHPRLWFTPEGLARARQWYAANPFSPRADDPLGQALRYLLGGDTAAADRAIASLMNFRNTMTDTGANQSNNYRWTEWIAPVYDWCHDRMTPDQRQQFTDSYNAYAEVWRAKSDQAGEWGGPDMQQNNYFWGYLRNEINWGIATYYENPQAPKFLQHALDARWTNAFVPHAAAGSLGAGGIVQEGTEYGAHLIDYSMMPFVSAANLGRNLYDETNFFKEAMFAQIYATTPGPTYGGAGVAPFYQTMPFNDDENSAGFPAAAGNDYVDYATVMASLYPDAAVGRYARAWLQLVGSGTGSGSPPTTNYVKALAAAVGPAGPAGDLSDLPTDYFAPGARYLFARNRWGADATAVDLQLGTPAAIGHEHHDVGTFHLWREGSWLAKETTGYVRPIVGLGGSGTVETDSPLAHNTLLLGNRGPAGQYYQSGPSRVTRLESNDDYTYVSVDLTPVYNSARPQSDNPYAGAVVREFLFVKALDTLLVFDRVEATAGGGITDPAAVAKTFLMHFPTAPTQVNATTFQANSENGSQVVRMTTLLPAGQAAPSYRVVDERPSSGAVWNVDYQHRLEATTSGSALSYLVNVLQARDAAGGDAQDVAASMSEDGSNFTITLNHPTRGTVVLRLNKGSATAAGSFAFAPAGQPAPTTGAPLIDRVQNVLVTDDGVEWEGIPDTAAPTASASAGAVQAANSNAHAFTVTYSDNTAVRVSSIGAGDVLVTGPNGFSQSATFVSVNDQTDGTPRTATYRIGAPAGGWTASHNGTYTINLAADQVRDTAGNAAAGGAVGTFTVNVAAEPDPTVPVASAGTSAVTAGWAHHWFTVTYTDDGSISPTCIGNGDVEVVAPDGSAQPGILSNRTSTPDGKKMTVTYRIPAPGGAWDNADNGTYLVRLRPAEVCDGEGNYAAAGTIGQITAALADAAAPTAADATPTLMSRNCYWFAVSYTDDAALDARTIDGGDVRVAGPNEFNQLAVLSSLAASSDGRTRTATYRVDAPGGGWDYAENGTYTLVLQPNQIADAAKNWAASRTLGTFDVAQPAPQTTTSAMTSAPAPADALRARTKGTTASLADDSSVL